MVATLGLARAGVGLLAGDAGDGLGLGQLSRGGLGGVGAGDGGRGDRVRVAALVAVGALAVLGEVDARLLDLVVQLLVRVVALVVRLAALAIAPPVARLGLAQGVGALVVRRVGLDLGHRLPAHVVRRLGLEERHRLVDRGAVRHLLDVADELAVQRVDHALVGELPAEGVERGQLGAAHDGDDLLAVLGLGRLGLDDGRLRQAVPELVGDGRQRAHDLLDDQLLLLHEGEARLVVVLAHVDDHLVGRAVHVDEERRALAGDDVAAEKVALAVGNYAERSVDDLLDKGRRHLVEDGLLDDAGVARLRRLDDDRRLGLHEHALGQLVDVALNGGHVANR